MKLNAKVYRQMRKAKNALEMMDLCRPYGLELSREMAERIMSIMHTRDETAKEELNQSASGWCRDIGEGEHIYYIRMPLINTGLVPEHV